ncbi:MAG TPA: hypothetical protein VGG86_10335 [Roseiarcus sp.]
MKKIFGFSIALSCAGLVSLSAAAGETSYRLKHHARHAHYEVSNPVARAPTPQASSHNPAVPPFSWLTQLFPNVKPYPPGQGDTDGLSRNPDDCNKGCVDNSHR